MSFITIKKKKQAGQTFKVNYQHESGNEETLFGHSDFNHQIQKPFPSVIQAWESAKASSSKPEF